MRSRVLEIVPFVLPITVALTLPAPVAGAEDAVATGDACAAFGRYSFVCGLKNPEDLVLVPGTQWIISSSMAAGGSIDLIDARRKSWTELYPGSSPRAAQDMRTYGGCPGAPDPAKLVTHGLNLRPGRDHHSTLYVVGHGGREAIEVFDVDAGGAAPALTWIGCILTPDGLAANSVASARDGSLLTTIPLRKGVPFTDAMAGKPTGGVYKWSPGDVGFTAIAGTDLPFPNGIELSRDGREFYVASSGLFTVTAYSNTNPARMLRSTGPLAFLPDNVHMRGDGMLLTAGLDLVDPVCGTISHTSEVSFEKFMTCPRPFTVLEIDPRSMKGKVVLQGPVNPHFSNITMALPVGGELWIGSFAGDRVAYTSVGH
jgi:hypothetical protein